MRSFRLGLFIFAALLFLGIGVFLIGSQNLAFHSKYELTARFPNVSGLDSGADVRVGGIRRGVVKSVALPRRPGDQVTVVMDLDDSTRNVIKQDSVAYIRSSGLLGDRYVEIAFGSPGAPAIKRGQVLRGEPALELSDLIKKANSLLDTAGGAMRNVEGITGNLNEISAKIEQGQGSVGALINSKQFYEQAKAGATAFQEDMEALKHNFLLRGFFEKRGYEDSNELTKDAVARLPGGHSLMTYSYDAKDLFDRSSAKLKNQKKLKDAGKFLESHRFGLAVVAAALGAKGDSDAVRQYLAQNFRLDDTRLKTIALGKSPNSSDNGTVEIIVYPPSNASSTASRTPGK
jgi:phospholipid/cholesterol/gamma-HCH transport system substrate-binding protein